MINCAFAHLFLFRFSDSISKKASDQSSILLFCSSFLSGISLFYILKILFLII